MNRQAWLSVCLTYCLSLFIAGLLGFPQANIKDITLTQWISYFLIITLLTIISTLTLPRYFYRLPTEKFWIIMGLLAIISVFYLQFRVPHPSANDVSKVLGNNCYQKNVILLGITDSAGQETETKRIRVMVKVKEIQIDNLSKATTGKVYVTLPPSEDDQVIYAGQNIKVTGTLYQPRKPIYSSGFDFDNYLERQGIFVGFKAEKVESIGKVKGIFNQMRKRIIESQKAWIPRQEASLISSMVLGSKAVTLPYELKQNFTKQNFTRVGMAHILAASGFQVTLLLGVILYLTRYSLPEKQLVLGIIILFFYLGLTGFHPSVLRASFMGVGVLIGSTVDRKKESVSLLLLSATLLLLFNPLWLQDLGFQLSFLATFGLLVTVTPLQNFINFLPPLLSGFISIPPAATLWTFPLLLYSFSVFISYAIPINIIAAPLVYIISLGGMISAGLALIIPVLGSAIAWLLYYPTLGLIQLAEFFIRLPGSQLVVGTQPLGIILIIYSLYILVWLVPSFQKKSPLIGLFIIVLLTIKPIYNHFFLTQVTLLNTQPEPIIIIQDRGKIIVLNYGNSSTNKYTINPFLSQQSFSQVDCVIKVGNLPYYHPSCLNSQEKIEIYVLQSDPNLITKHLKPFSKDQIISIGSIQLQLLRKDPLIFEFRLHRKKWLWLLEKNPLDEIYDSVLSPDVFLWSGNKLSWNALKWLKGKTVIDVNLSLSEKRQQFFDKREIKVYSLIDQDSILWQPKKGIIINSQKKNKCKQNSVSPKTDRQNPPLPRYNSSF